MTYHRSIASRMETQKNMAKHRKYSYIYAHFDECFRGKSYLEVSTDTCVYTCIVFMAILNVVL